MKNQLNQMFLDLSFDLLWIEQPDSIKGDKWFFCKEYGNFGAACGVTLDRKEVENRLSAECGSGKLVFKFDRWWWKLNKK